MDEIPVAARAANIEYAIRDVVVPATALEAEGHEIIKLNIGDPIAYPGLPTPRHMIEAFQNFNEGPTRKVIGDSSLNQKWEWIAGEEE